MILLDGKAISKSMLESLTREIGAIRDAGHRIPKLSVILVGEDPASQVYVKKKAQTAEKIGMLSELIVLPADISEAALRQEVQRLNKDSAVDAILIQLPLPKHINSNEILTLVNPDKDVDGFHPHNLGKLMMGQLPPALPCTPAGIMKMMEAHDIPIQGKHAVVIGRSTIVGKPVGMLLLQKNATVTFCHSHTKDLPGILKTADIIIAAVGVPEMVTGDHVKEGVVVIDVGINRTAEGKLVGDVHFDSVAQKASHLTPVPGGVGPMTIATLMSNTLALYKARTASAEFAKA